MKSKRLLLLAGVLLAAALALYPVLTGGSAAAPAAGRPVKAGADYLAALETAPISEVDNALRERRIAQIAREREDMLQKLYNQEIEVWPQMEHSVVLGDARAVGFSWYGYLEKAQVLADGSYTIRNVAQRLEEAAALQPDTVYLCFGINDVNIGFWTTPEDYAAEVREVAESVQKRIPGATVVVSSILPARGSALTRAPKWAEIPAYNDAVEAMCRSSGFGFADNSACADAHEELWQPDGVHLQPDYYPLWACNLVAAAEEAREVANVQID